MNENINLCEILKGHADETFWNPLVGNITYKGGDGGLVFFQYGNSVIDIPYNGKDMDNNIAVFPSKNQRDWNKWVAEQKEFEPKFKEGDIVRYKGQNHEIGKIAKYWGEEDPGKYSVRFGKEYHNISESMLELYDPEEIVSLKEKYWETGNIFEMSTGEKRVVWFDNLIDAGGFIPKALFNDNLVNTDSTIGEHVIRIYAPNTNSGYFKELTKTRGKKLLWSKSDFIFTEQEIKEKLRIPEEEELIIIKR